jgi:threonine dehydratase
VDRVPSIEDIRVAADRIAPYVHRTPVVTSGAIDRMIGGHLFFKCENFQKVGAFKIRGATNAVFSLSDGQAAKGVATHSSGNHAAALAQAALFRGIGAIVVMPDTAPRVKKEAVAGYGAEIVYCAPTLEAREEGLDKILNKTGATPIHPYDDFRIIAGQATAAMELLEEVDGLDMVIAPVGGGGLLSGTALAVSAMSAGTRIFAAEPELADDAQKSIRAGRIIPSTYPDTIADGLRTSLCERTFGIIREHVEDVVTVSEEEIVAAMRCIWGRMKLVVEPSAAVPLAALLGRGLNVAKERVGVILTGGNVDLDNLPWNRSGVAGSGS